MVNAPDRLRIAEFLPISDVSASHEIRINAPPSFVYQRLLVAIRGSNAHALFKSPRLDGNLFGVPTWESVFPKGGSHEVRAECAVTGASDAHNH